MPGAMAPNLEGGRPLPDDPTVAATACWKAVTAFGERLYAGNSNHRRLPRLSE
jgi:hypothetical protein